MRPPAGLLAAALILLLLPGARVARAASSTPERGPGDVVPLASLRSGTANGSPSLRLYTSVDTVIVFNHNLEGLSSPGNEGGWTHVDQSGQPTAWNISNLYACGSNAFWCGLVDSSWTGDPNRRGYANSWVQILENFVNLTGAPSPYTLSFKVRMNVESGYDRGYVEVSHPTEQWIPLATLTGVVNDGGGSLCNVYTVTIPDSVVAASSPLHFRFHFVSDIQVSSEDGLYPAGEGWSIDDVTVKGGVSDIRFFDDMESGMGTWTRSAFPPVGDYWKIVSNPITQQVCTTNTTKVWQCTDMVSGALVPRQDDKLVSPAIAVNRSDQVLLYFDVYRDLPFESCFYYGVTFRTRNAGAPAWSSWIDPNGALYYGIEREWLRQTIPLAGAAGVDSIQFRIGVKDYGPIYCGGSQAISGTQVLFDNFQVGVTGAAGPSITAVESDLYNDTFRTTAFFGNDNFNTPHGDSVAVKVSAAHGLKSASLKYSLNNAPFATVALTKVGASPSNNYFADVPASNYPRGTDLRYYFTATDSLDAVATLPADALAANHYYRATILPAIQPTSGPCPDDTARILYVNATSGPDLQTGIGQSLAAIGARFDRFDVNAPASGAGNALGGGNPANPGPVWPAVPLATLGIYKAIVWDTGDRAAATLSAQDQTLLQNWLALTGKNRGLLLSGDNIAYDMSVNGQGIANFLSCTMGVTYLRDIWEDTPQDSLTPALAAASGTRIFPETFPIDGGCPAINRFDALVLNSCAGTTVRQWLRYPNTYSAATERRDALGPPGADSVRAMLLGFSLDYMTSSVRRNLFLYRTLVEEFENPSCYPATGVPVPPPAVTDAAARLYPAVPNPFNPRTMIRFELKRPARARLRIFAVDGSLVRTLADRAYPAGEQRLYWDGRNDRGRDVGSGAYFVSLEADGIAAPGRKVILLR
jgi:flagellar hook capping protein FlgD